MNFRTFLVVICVLLSSVSRAYDFSDNDVIYMQLLFKEGADAKKKGLRAVHRTPGISTTVYDLIAESLLLDVEEEIDVDIHAWYFKALSQSGVDRYTNVMAESLRRTVSHEKLAKHHSASLKKMTTKSEAQYKKGDIDVVALKAEISARVVKQREKKPLKHADLFYLERCSSLEYILDRLGVPDSMGKLGNSSGFTSFNEPTFNLQLNYDQFATLLVERHREKVWCLYSLSAESIESLLAPISDPNLLKVRKLAWSYGRDTLAEAARIAHSKVHRGNEAFLDELALRLWWGRFDKNIYIQAGLTHLAKVIYKSQNSRYWTAINTTNNSTSSEKVMAFTKKYIKKVNKKELEQFVPEMLLVSDAHNGNK